MVARREEAAGWRLVEVFRLVSEAPMPRKRLTYCGPAGSAATVALQLEIGGELTMVGTRVEGVTRTDFAAAPREGKSLIDRASGADATAGGAVVAAQDRGVGTPQPEAGGARR